MSEEVNWQQLAEGFRLERNIMQEMAMNAQAKVEHWEKIHQNDLMHMVEHARRNREAGSREGLRMAEDWVGRIAREVDEHDGYLNFCASIQEEIHRALIDFTKGEGEKPPKMLYVAFDCLGNPYAVSTRPEHIACDPARIKPYVPVEAEGEETK